MDLWDFSMGFNKIRLEFFTDISWELNDHLMGHFMGFHLDFINGF